MATVFDQQKIDYLVDLYNRTVYQLAYAYVGNKSDAEDVMQEVFMRYIKRKPVFENDEHEKAWFLRTTINCCKSFLSSSWKKNVALTDETYGGNSAETPSNDLLEVIAQLKPEQRMVTHLFYYEDMSLQEIAKKTAMPLSTVKSHLKRAKSNLKKLLQKGDDYVQ